MHLQMFKLPLRNKWKILYMSLRKGSVFHEGMNPRELLVRMKNKNENMRGIKAAERYFYLLWKSKSLQSNDCGKTHDILI